MGPTAVSIFVLKHRGLIPVILHTGFLCARPFYPSLVSLKFPSQSFTWPITAAPHSPHRSLNKYRNNEEEELRCSDCYIRRRRTVWGVSDTVKQADKHFIWSVLRPLAFSHQQIIYWLSPFVHYNHIWGTVRIRKIRLIMDWKWQLCWQEMWCSL